MGAEETKTPRHVEVGRASEFYWACRNGNYEKVKEMLRHLNYEQLNQVEPNGSTALHAATHFNHLEIVRLLLEAGCSRTTLNRYSQTAYEEIRTEEMRSLFHRPVSLRFVDENPTQSFGLSFASDNDVQIGNNVPDNWVKGYSDKQDAHEASFMNAIARAPLLMRKVLRQRLEQEHKELFEEFVRENVMANQPLYDRVINLFNEFKKKKSIESLLTLYTLETPIYNALQDDCRSLTALLYLYLPALEDRAYKGIAYRGARMTSDDLEAYRWAYHQSERILETRTIQSMSKNKQKALEFANDTMNRKPISILLIFDFPDVCRTAINLNKISEKKIALSDYQDEEEITLLPFTLFNVIDIKTDAHNYRQYRITLKNIPVPKKSVAGAWFGMHLQ